MGLLAAAPTGLALLALSAAFLGLRRLWPDRRPGRAALLLPALAALLPALLLDRPADPARECLSALRADPLLLLDMPGCAPLAALAPWPLALLLDEPRALAAASAAALAIAALLVHAAARALGQGEAPAILAQMLFLLLPVVSAAVARPRFELHLTWALQLLLLVHLLRRMPHLSGARDAAAACCFIALAQAGSRLAIVQVTFLVLAFALLEAAAGKSTSALRLLGAWAVATPVMALLDYGRSLPAAARHLLQALSGPGSWSARPLLARYDMIDLLLTAVGLLALRAGPRHGQSAVLALLAAGLALCSRDGGALLALAVPIASAAGLVAFWQLGRPGRLVAALLLLTGLAFDLLRGAAAFRAP